MNGGPVTGVRLFGREQFSDDGAPGTPSGRERDEIGHDYCDECCCPDGPPRCSRRQVQTDAIKQEPPCPSLNDEAKWNAEHKREHRNRGRLSREVTDSCLQYWGGMGFMNETRVSRAFRDTRLGSIGGGADEIMLNIICKLMGTLPGSSNKSAKTH